MKAMFTERRTRRQLQKKYAKAERLMQDEDQLERFLRRLEKKLRHIPVAGPLLADVPVMASLVRSYVKKSYTDLPLGTVLSVLSALLYFVAPIDVLPDLLPALGFADDAAVVGLCWKLAHSDIEEYAAWRDSAAAHKSELNG